MRAGQYLTFKLETSRYGVSIESVREINRLTKIAKVPEAPHYVAGVINLRGKIISVIDLRKRLNMPEVEATKETCIIVMETKGGQVGVIVDSVQAVVDLTSEQIDDSPLQDDKESFVRSIGKLDEELIMLIEIDQCLHADPLSQAA